MVFGVWWFPHWLIIKIPLGWFVGGLLLGWGGGTPTLVNPNGKGSTQGKSTLNIRYSQIISFY
jgi:hypothetical protein